MSEDFSIGKSPISLLQEICVKKDLVPQYDVVTTDGPTHQPTFCFRVTAGQLSALGKGSNKKAAKHAAAQNIISIINSGSPLTSGLPPLSYMGDVDAPIKQRPISDSSTPPNVPGRRSLSALMSVPTDSFGVNPVGELQEYAQKRGLPPPDYEYPQETGPPHARIFACLVTFDKQQEKGTAKTKKDAKREAAGRMMQLLRRTKPHGSMSARLSSIDQNSNNSDEDSAFIPLGDDEDPLEYEAIKSKSIRTLTPAGSQAASDFFDNLRKDPGNNLLGLQDQHWSAASRIDYVKKLGDIATEKRFNVVYVDIEEVSKSGKYQCLVQLSTEPVAVCFGTASTAEGAQQEAAYNSLQYLRIMTSSD